MKLISNSLDYTIYPFVFRELQHFQEVGISATGFIMRQLLLLLFFLRCKSLRKKAKSRTLGCYRILLFLYTFYYAI